MPFIVSVARSRTDSRTPTPPPCGPRRRTRSCRRRGGNVACGSLPPSRARRRAASRWISARSTSWMTTERSSVAMACSACFSNSSSSVMVVRMALPSDEAYGTTGHAVGLHQMMHHVMRFQVPRFAAFPAGSAISSASTKRRNWRPRRAIPTGVPLPRPYRSKRTLEEIHRGLPRLRGGVRVADSGSRMTPRADVPRSNPVRFRVASPMGFVTEPATDAKKPAAGAGSVQRNALRFGGLAWWLGAGSNRRPQHYECRALTS